MIQLKLTPAEALLLDGKVGPEAQALVDQAKGASQFKYLLPHQAVMLAEVAAKAREAKIVTSDWRSARYCPFCKKDVGYYKFKSGPRKGQDKDIEKSMSVRDLDKGFCIVKNRVFTGYCRDCEPIAQLALRIALAGVQAEIPGDLATGPRYSRHELYACACGWKGDDTQLLEADNGFRTAKTMCPACRAQPRLFSTQGPRATGEYVCKEIG